MNWSDQSRARATRRLRVLFQNRRGVDTLSGGDGVVMQRCCAELERLGVETDIALADTDPSRYDVVHLFNLALPELLEEDARSATRAGVPFVVTCLYEDWPRFLGASQSIREAFRLHLGGEWDEHKLRHGFEALRHVECTVENDNTYAARHAACLLASGESERERLLQDYPDAKRVEVVFFGGDCPGNRKLDSGAFRTRHKLRDYVLCVGRLEPRKNQLMLLEALRRDSIPLVFVTGGHTTDTEYDDMCRRFPRQAPTLFLERLEDDLLISAYRGASVLAVPSWYELPGLTALEAAGLGCPVVASGWGTLPDYLGDHVIYCEPNNPESIRQAIFRALSEPSSDALAHRAQEHTWARTAWSLLKVYRGAQQRRAFDPDRTLRREHGLAAGPCR